MALCAHTIAATIATEDRKTDHDHIADIERYTAEELQHTVAGTRCAFELVRFPPNDTDRIRAAYDEARTQHEKLSGDPYMALPDAECERMLVELSDLRDELRALM